MTIQQIESEAMMEHVIDEMRKDGHGVPSPTHVVLGDGGSVIGSYSLAYAPCLFFWMHTKRANALSSYRALKRAIMDVLDETGRPAVLIVETESVYLPFIERMGHVKLGSGNVYI